MSLRIGLLSIFVFLVYADCFGQSTMISIIDQDKSSDNQYYIKSDAHKTLLRSGYSSFSSVLPFVNQDEPLVFKRLDINSNYESKDHNSNETLHYAAFKKGEYIVNLTVADQITVRHSSGGGNFSYLPDNQGMVSQVVDKHEVSSQVCGLQTTKSYIPSVNTLKSGEALPSVGVYFEVDHYTFLDFGRDTEAIIEWVEILFAEVAAIYAMDGIKLVISEIFIWEQDDIYDSDFLNPTFSIFTDRMAAEGFNGHIAQLITTKPFGRGLAYLSEPCNTLSDSTSLPIGISPRLEKTTIYSVYYDCNRYVLTHEIGHTLGSHHSHDCVWGPDYKTAIDNCSNSGCNGATPSNGGTIMSYCNLTTQGINFAQGLGDEPAQRMKDIIANLSCLTPVPLCETDTSCDDGDPCTQNDVYDEDCSCAGTLIDNDANGICDVIESCEENAHLVSAISNDTIIAAKEFIVAESHLMDNSEVLLSAGTELTFNPGFEISIGSELEAIVMTCDNE